MKINNKPSRQSQSKKRLIAGLCIVVLIIGIGAALELSNTTHLLHTAPAVSGKIPVTNPSRSSVKPAKNSQPSTTPTTPAPTPTNTPQKDTTSGNSSSTAGSTSATTLQAPFGSFVSNHSPNLGGNPAPSGEQSTCVTSPGASCTLTFTNDDGVVKTLPAQTVDSSGNTTWLWDIKTAGFTVGNWRITASATLDGQTKISTDQLPLKVQP